jgi:YD repeat-containing protein
VVDGQGNVATYNYDAVGNPLSITRNTGKYESALGAIAHEGDKSLLLEVSVGGQSFGDPTLSHHHHGPAIGQAVSLIGPRFVQGEAFPKGRSTEGQHLHSWREEDAFHHLDRRATDGRTTDRVRVEHFRQHRISGQEPDVPQAHRQFNRTAVMVIEGIGQCEPVGRVGEDDFQDWA